MFNRKSSHYSGTGIASARKNKYGKIMVWHQQPGISQQEQFHYNSRERSATISTPAQIRWSISSHACRACSSEQIQSSTNLWQLATGAQDCDGKL